MKVLFDTCVLFSRIGRPKDKECLLQHRATKVIDKCNNLNYTKCISLRTIIEFENGWQNVKDDEKKEKEKALLNEFVQLPYYYGNETWDQIEAPWGNIYSAYENEKDSRLSEIIVKHLSGDKNKRDRDIFLDALMNDCEKVISENWNDFKKLEKVGVEYGIEVTTPDCFIK